MSAEPTLNVAGKSELVAGYAARYGFSTLIETGLYNGSGTGMRLDRLALGIAAYFALDNNVANIIAAERTDPGALCLFGDSGETLPALLAALEAPALFWLDAHTNTEIGDPIAGTPLGGELLAIRAWDHGAASVVLIDDARLIDGPGWPTMRVVRALASPWTFELADDVIRLTP